MKVLIADDQADVVNALRFLLEQQERQFIIEEAGDADSLPAKVGKMQPQLLLLDWELSNRDMSGVIPEIKRAAPGIRIIAMSVSPEAESAALSAGADAFVSKGDNSDMLLSVIDTIR
ncbi:MAG: response regulator transcription factor [Clostridiaceae bacterium]|jgi:DNA-binding NarL/FixJ family response regulator|nr:response regulator transcription factor [Clostridiaceae bacterium]